MPGRPTNLFVVGDEQKVGYEELLATSKAAFEAVPDFTVAVEEEFALLDPVTLDLLNRFEDVRDGAQPRDQGHEGRDAGLVLAALTAQQDILVELVIEIGH